MKDVARGSTSSILNKDNHYPVPLYCSPAGLRAKAPLLFVSQGQMQPGEHREPRRVLGVVDIVSYRTYSA